MVKSKFGEKIDGWVQALFPFLFRRPVDPNLLTLLGTGVSALAAVAFAMGQFPLAGVLLILGGVFDLVDGVVARHFQISTAFGAFLDSTMDRLVDMVVLLGIVVHYGLVGETVGVVLAGLVLVSSVLTSYAKARAELFVDHLGGGIFERGERIVGIAIGGLFGIMMPVLWILAIGTTLTALQRFAAAHRALDGIELDVEIDAGTPAAPATGEQ